MSRFILIAILLFSSLSRAEEGKCPEETLTSPAPVEMAKLKQEVHVLADLNSKPVFNNPAALDKEIEKIFDLITIKTKMEQFYTMLWALGVELRKQNVQDISLSKQSVQNVLIASKVFTDPQVPSQIQSIRFDLKDKDKPKYYVTFTKAGVNVELNQGNGFYLFRNGKCQHAQKLIFEQSFSFEMKRNLGNLMVYNFEGVDLFGDFGNRGIVDVDIQYVTLRSVEFFTGTINGRVVAYVSREEFKKNEHSGVLKLLTRIVPDRSVQPIDW